MASVVIESQYPLVDVSVHFSHSMPPFIPSSLTVLFLHRKPPPQVAEQVLHELHALHAQSTTKKPKFDEVC